MIVLDSTTQRGEAFSVLVVQLDAVCGGAIVFELKKHLDESELSVFTGLVKPVSSLVVLGVELLK